MYGKDFGYASTRLDGTIVRIANTNEPIMVQFVRGDGLVNGWGLKDNQPLMVSLDDLNLKPVRLGYVNHKNTASYLQRIPMRKDWKQGLRAQNCVSSSVFFQNIHGEEIRNTIMGVFPTFLESLSGRKKTAFHRHWATHRTKLFYKDVEVGIIKGRIPILNEKFNYLKEYLQECIK